MQINNKKPIRVLDLFNLGEDYQGKEFKVVTDNEHYGKTITFKDGQLIDKRKGLPMLATIDLMLKTKVKFQESETKVSLDEFLEAYKLGKKVKIIYKGQSREFVKSPEELNELPGFELISILPLNKIITLNTLLYGEFYIIN
ncbi:hypothetical protein [Bacillus atrophaeus]|uniref:hypothetical protein n=1 Tax=Bacillus atrophaeus TaxID=1452 RepID=UPI001C10E717|nr:hypothetical protein [Bacillus atrophaeus]MBU5262056.1 hypothetical protein [Bacillus atrophaeus]MCY8466491.1 hypothetical protein [Bacillus atrophaeus]MCY8478950.1 hypothetical protein [Bacillus atrophaeus]